MTRIPLLAISTLCLVPLAAIANSTGPPTQRTGNPVDAAGLTCTACHRTFAVNSDARGGVKVTAQPYVPGVTQTVQVTISHPEALRWGFQLTARPTSDATKMAGTFAAGSPAIRVRCQGGGDGPCQNGVQEFASHRSAVIPGSAVGSYTYSVEWTPPTTNVGDIVLYVAGNAANNSATNAGDYIYNSSAIVPPAKCDISGVPQISSVVNSASYGSRITPNALITLFGSGFQPANLTRQLYPADLADNKLPLSISCVAVEVNGKRAPISYASSGQINAVVPTGTFTGNADVRVVLNTNATTPVVSSPATVTNSSFAPALFTVDGKKAVAQFSGTTNLVGDASIPGAKAAKAGDLVTLYATGLGEVAKKLDAGDLATAENRIINLSSVRINGTALTPGDVLYVGAVPGSTAGLYQINIRIPAGVKAGDATLNLAVGNAVSPDGVTILLQ